MTTIIPMAGKGERFLKKGYTIPKPLIEINGTPMVLKAVADLPTSDQYFFIVLKEHLKNTIIEKRIRNIIPQAQFIALENVTEGQACTCMLALPHINGHEDILIGACDNGMIYSSEAFEIAKKETDVLVFSFRNNVAVKSQPEQYGWVSVNEKNEVLSISVKKPISNNPINDHAIIGTFWFKEAEIFEKSVNKMVAENRRINNEFYVDECINDAISLGYKVSVFDVDKYICWGTPDDYETYNYWHSFFGDKNLFP